MCTSCLPLISQFRQNTQPSPWALDRGLVADRLLELLEHPDSLQQGAIGLCGPAAFLRAWLLNDHLAVVRFAIELYQTGASHVGPWAVAAAPQLMACNHAAIDWGGRTPCPVTEWMMMGAIQDQQNTFRPDWEGQPVNDWTLGMIAGDVAGMLGATGRYDRVDNGTAVIPQNIFDDNGCDDALTLAPDDHTDVVMLINAGLINAGSIDHGDGAFWNNNVSNHYIGLCQPAQRVKENGADVMRMSYFSWGQVYENETFPCAQFDSCYYGAIVAHARLPREPLPDTTPARPGVPTKLGARIDGKGVRVTWCGSSVNEEKYDIERYRAGTGGWDGLWQVDAPRPSTATSQWLDDGLPVLAADTVWYRVRAVNRHGAGDWSAFVMLSLPHGSSRLVDPQRDLDIRRPPPFLQRVSVMRAPPGLQPTGYGAFPAPAHECEAAQWVYDRHWEVTSSQTRQSVTDHDRPLRADRQAYVFLQFNDYDGPGHADMDPASLRLRMTGRTPSGMALDFDVPLQAAADRSFHWGHFDAAGYNAAYKLNLEVHGRDTVPRYAQRSPDGHQLDSDPRSRARPRLDHPPRFDFEGYAPGPDRQHVLQVAARAAALADDAFEPNDSHAQARSVSLLPVAGSGTALADLPALSFGKDVDADHFLVSYPASAADDACPLTQPARHVLSACLGLSLVNHPPALTVSVYTDDPLCVDMALYRADGVQRTHDLPRTRRLTIYNPTRTHFPDHRFELVLKNANAPQQGCFAYRLNLHYQPAMDDWVVDTGAPAYRPRTTEARKLLQALYRRIDLPRPGEDFRTRYQRDTRLLLQRTAAVLLDPLVVAELKALLPAHSVAAIAEDCRRTATLARAYGLYAEAEGLLRSAAGRTGLAHDRPGQISALQDLQTLFTDTGRVREAATIGARVKQLAEVH